MTTPEQARRMVRDAIKRGDLVRPDTCARCGAIPPPASDGRATIHGHHHDYNAPLDVEWICAGCHRAETPLPAVVGGISLGENNGAAKLTAEVVRDLLSSDKSTRSEAKRLGVDRAVVRRIRQRKTWRHVVLPPTEAEIDRAARIIDPEAWSINPRNGELYAMDEPRRQRALTKARAILSASPVLSGGGMEASCTDSADARCFAAAKDAHCQSEGDEP